MPYYESSSPLRPFTIRLGGILSLLLLLSLSCTRESNHNPPAKAPNIIFILADDFGRELLSCYGGSSYKTPALDAIAKGGLIFRTCYATPLCAPSRTMLLTGRYNFRNYTDWDEMDFTIKTIAHYMSESGYATGMVGKWHRGGWQLEPKGPAKAGFMEYCSYDYSKYNTERKKEESCYWGTTLWRDGVELELDSDQSASDYFNQYAIDFIDRHAGHPFFLYYAMDVVHRPFVSTPAQVVSYDSLTRKGLSRERGRAENFPFMVEYADQLVGRIVEAVNQKDLKNTIIIFAGDNGTDNIAEASNVVSTFNGRQVKGGKYYPSELGVNVPFILYAPHYVSEGKFIDGVIDFADLLPTCFELAGGNSADLETDGRSFAPLITKPDLYKSRKWVYSYGNYENSSEKYKAPARHPDAFVHAISDGKWKYYSDDRLFYVLDDILEEHEIPAGRSKEEDSIRGELRQRLDSLRNSRPKLW